MPITRYAHPPRECPTCHEAVQPTSVDQPPVETTWDDMSRVPSFRTFKPGPAATVELACGHRVEGVEGLAWIEDWSATQWECCCPLVDVSRFGPQGVKPAFLRGDPRGSNCPLHETEEMRNEIEAAKNEARYGIHLEFPTGVSEQEAEAAKRRFLDAYNREYPYVPMRPDPWLKPRPVPADTSWIKLEPVGNHSWGIVLVAVGAVALVALIIVALVVAGD